VGGAWRNSQTADSNRPLLPARDFFRCLASQDVALP
jgi:hypothetical protein